MDTTSLATPDAPSPGPSRTPAQPPSADEYTGTGTQRPAFAQNIFARTNDAREARGRAALAQDSTLARIACWHNQDMLVHDYMAHEDADRRRPSDRLAREHRRLIGTAGENVFEGRASSRNNKRWDRAAMKSWLESEGHRANILRPSFTHLGVCVTQQESIVKATQLFSTVWAYLDTPLPWALSPGDSVAVGVQPLKAAGPPAEYAFVPVGEPLGQAFKGEDRGHPFNDTLRVPSTPDQYGTRFLFPVDETGRYTILSGPRVSVERSAR